MAYSTLKHIPELQQIEAIIKWSDYKHLSSTVLCRVPCEDELLPIYALTLGNRVDEVPCIVYVAGIHGLERIGTQVVIAFLEALLERLAWDQVTVDLL
ncbi:MAG: zinc carboxypeptidase, partial [Nitrosomonas sp.]|nr:zinc carboxypeptidase [Nitrosomonas sp.]